MIVARSIMCGVLVSLGCPGNNGARTTGGSGVATFDPSGSGSDTEIPIDTQSSNASDDPATDDGSTSLPDGCTCEAGSVVGCSADNEQEICEDDCMSTRVEPCETGFACIGSACTLTGCETGELRCADDVHYEVCNDLHEWDPAVACGEAEGCNGGQCLTLCELIEQAPTSQGCSFRANAMQTINPGEGALIVGNVSETLTATAQLYFLEGGGQTPQGAPVALAPGATHTFPLTAPKMGTGTVLRTEGSYRVESDIPIIAYQHSPIGAQQDNDASMLLPDHAAGQEFIISSYEQNIGGAPSYFNVIALIDGTQVDWIPPVATPAGTGVAAVAAGGTGTVMMNAGDTLQIASTEDLTGTRVVASENVWVVGAVVCVQVPTGYTACDHIEEQQLPMTYWGTTYVAAHAPTRGNEQYVWRVFGGDDGVTIDTDPVQPGFPMALDDGEWIEFSASGSFVITGDGPFMPVQYIVGQNAGAGTGDPAMYQMVPVEQFLDRYAFVTGTGYNVHYVQVTREAGAADVFVDGVMVSGYYTVGEYEVADWQIGEGSHLAESDDPFGIASVGYTGYTSYAYPGGLRLEVINPG